MLTSTMQSWRGRTVSPVYTLLPNLEEPQWKKLRVGGVCEYWESFDSWKRRLEQARRLDLLGDMLVLADEAPVAALRAEGLLAAGKALRKADRFALALDTLERGRPIVAADPELQADLLREQGICLERLATLPPAMSVGGLPTPSIGRATTTANSSTICPAIPGSPKPLVWPPGWTSRPGSPSGATTPLPPSNAGSAPSKKRPCCRWPSMAT
jgi:hypothetical protein